MIKLEWNTAVVTGASRGIGRGIALRLAESGVKKIGIGYLSNEEAATAAADEVRKRGAEPMLLRADVTKPDDVRGLFDRVKEAYGELGVFVHNARPNPGTDPWFAAPMDIDENGLDAAYRSQPVAMAIACQRCKELMPNGGRIIAVAHGPGATSGSWQSWVGMGPAKAALESTLRYFAVCFAQDKITVNAVSPNLIDDSVINGLPPEVFKGIKDWNTSGWTPMRRLGTPADVGKSVALLCAEEAEFITGQTLYVDGGASLMYPEMPLPIQGIS